MRIYLALDTEGEKGRVLIISAEDLGDSGNYEFYRNILGSVFDEIDLDSIMSWFESNIGGATATLRAGDANIMLFMNGDGHPVLYITDDDYVDWVDIEVEQ